MHFSSILQNCIPSELKSTIAVAHYTKKPASGLQPAEREEESQFHILHAPLVKVENRAAVEAAAAAAAVADVVSYNPDSLFHFLPLSFERFNFAMAVTSPPRVTSLRDILYGTYLQQFESQGSNDITFLSYYGA